MRFCIITPRFCRNDGQGRVNLAITAEAVRQGHEVVIIAEEADAQGEAQAGFRLILLAPPGWLPTRLLRDQLFAWRSRRAVAGAGRRADALLANGFVTWVRCDVNAVHFVHDSWLRSIHHPWRAGRSLRSLYARIYTGLNARLERAAFRRATRVVAVSGRVAQELLRIGVPAQRLVTIANGVDTVEFRPGPTTRPVYHLPDTARIVLFAGDLRSPRKNLDTVLRALAMVEDLHLAVAGKHQGTVYPGMVAALGLAERVHFLGFRTDMPELMRAADLLVFPSRYEPCGLVLLEALASGVPVITARNVGGAELIGPEVGVVLEDGDDAAALAAALRRLACDDGGRRAMSLRARALAERHCIRAMASRYVEVMVQVGRQRGAAPHGRDADRRSARPRAASYPE